MDMLEKVKLGTAPLGRLPEDGAAMRKAVIAARTDEEHFVWSIRDAAGDCD